jgi:hypothetical protein
LFFLHDWLKYNESTINTYNPELYASIISKVRKERLYDELLSKGDAAWDIKDMDDAYHMGNKDIYNVIDMRAALRDMFMNPNIKKMNDAANRGKRWLATLNIYEDRTKEMEFLFFDREGEEEKEKENEKENEKSVEE